MMRVKEKKKDDEKGEDDIGQGDMLSYNIFNLLYIIYEFIQSLNLT